MGYFFDAIKALRTSLANAFRPPQTVEFPEVVRPRAERYKASFALPDDEHGELACVGCLACEKICPSQIIKMKSTGKKESPVTGKKRQYVEEFTLDLTACIQCELCVQVCNSDAIYMIREPEVPGWSREDLVLDINRLRENAKNKTAAWGRGTILQEMQEGKKPEKAEKPKPAPAPEAAKATPEAKPAEAKPAAEPKAEAKPEPAKAEEPKPEPVKAEAKPLPDEGSTKIEIPKSGSRKSEAPAADTAAKTEPVVEGRTP